MAHIGGPKHLFHFACAVRRHFAVDDEGDNSSRLAEKFMDGIGEPFMYYYFPPRRLRHFIECENETIGEGGFGTIFKGRATRLGLRRIPSLEREKVYAVKRIQLTPMLLSRASRMPAGWDVDQLTDGVNKLLSKLGTARRPDIISFYAQLVEFPNHVYMVMELLRGPDLYDFLSERRRTLDEFSAADVAGQIFSAINYLHRTAGILHRDIKLENFGFLERVRSDGLPKLKLFDFGLCFLMPEQVDDRNARDTFELAPAGTKTYWAPETREDRCGPGLDVWAAGIILYLLLTLALPFGLQYGQGDPQQSCAKNPLEFPEDGPSEAARSLLARLLEKDPARRISAAEVLEDDWLAAPGTAPEVEKTQSTLPEKTVTNFGLSELSFLGVSPVTATLTASTT